MGKAMTTTTDQLKDLLAKVTPGEWHVDSRETRVDNFGNIQHDPPRIVWPQNESSGSICKCHLRGGGDPDQALSNATLIALAPTLAAEVMRLREALNWIADHGYGDGGRDCAEHARQALDDTSEA